MVDWRGEWAEPNAGLGDGGGDDDGLEAVASGMPDARSLARRSARVAVGNEGDLCGLGRELEASARGLSGRRRVSRRASGEGRENGGRAGRTR